MLNADLKVSRKAPLDLDLASKISTTSLPLVQDGLLGVRKKGGLDVTLRREREEIISMIVCATAC